MDNNSLLYKISSVDYLTKAWLKLNKTNELSHGLSDESIKTFDKDKEDKIQSISKKLREGKYHFSPYRPVLIPKRDGTERPLQIPEIQDRLVFKALALELEEIFNDTLKLSEGISFAYQKNIGIRQAIEKIKNHYQAGNTYVFESDLVDFFTSVDKELLLRDRILPKLPDTSINQLLIDGLSQNIGKIEKLIPESKQHYFENCNKGVPQGNPLSPLFSNIYLSPFDLHLKSKGFNLVRYADDFVILCDSRDRCMQAYEESLNILSSDKLKLTIHELDKANKKGKVKTQIFDIHQHPLHFLSITFDGKNIFPSRENVDGLKEKIKQVCHEEGLTVATLLTKLSNKLDGWVSAFYYTNLDRYSKEIDSYINRQVFLSLRSLEWRFNLKHIGKLPVQYKEKRQSGDCLSFKQRRNSGIPICKDLISKKRADERKRVKNKTK